MAVKTLTTVVVVQKDGILVSAEVKVAEYVRTTTPLMTSRLTVLNFHPLAVVTGVGYSWIQPESPASHQLRGLTVMPVFEPLGLGASYVIDETVCRAALDYFESTDPAHLTRQVHGLVLEVSFGDGPVLLNLKAEYQVPDEGREEPFQLLGVSPSGRAVQGL